MSVVTVVAQVPLPAAIGPAAPTQRVIVTVEGDESEMEPSLVTWLTTVMVQETPCPPTLLAASSLHCIIDGACASADEGPAANRVSASRTAGKMAPTLAMNHFRRGLLEWDGESGIK